MQSLSMGGDTIFRDNTIEASAERIAHTIFDAHVRLHAGKCQCANFMIRKIVGQTGADEGAVGVFEEDFFAIGRRHAKEVGTPAFVRTAYCVTQMKLLCPHVGRNLFNPIAGSNPNHRHARLVRGINQFIDRCHNISAGRRILAHDFLHVPVLCTEVILHIDHYKGAMSGGQAFTLIEQQFFWMSIQVISLRQ